MLKLYIANKNYSSWSLRPWVLLRALGIPFEEILVPFEPSADSRGFRSFSPSGKVPCLIDGETVVWDSLAIVEYVAEAHPLVWPASREARAFARSASAEMHSGFTALRTHCSMSCGVRVRLASEPEALVRDWARVAEIWEEGLRRFGGDFLAGERFTAVDAFFAPVVFRAQTYGARLPDKASEYIQRMLRLPAMQEWYEAALREPWRDEGHEAEVRALAAEIQDLRAGRPAA